MDYVELNDLRYTLPELEPYLWTLLLNGALRSKDDLHTAQFATLTAEGLPDVRTVVLRKAFAEQKVLWFHTDARAEKVAQIAVNPNVFWHFYDARRRMQFRLKAIATVHSEGEIQSLQWQNTPMMSRKCYLTPHSPGSISAVATSGLPLEMEARDPEPHESEIGAANFVVVTTQILRLEWLFLHHAGHRRARFSYDEQGKMLDAAWLIP
jgi:pyridoxamine 5'-phosphate oxidase